MKQWPKNSKPAKVDDIVNPLIRVYQDYQAGKPTKYKGLPLTLCNLLASSFNIDEQLSPKSIKYSIKEQGGSFMQLLLLCALQLGIEQADRIERSDGIGKLYKEILEEKLKRYKEERSALVGQLHNTMASHQDKCKECREDLDILKDDYSWWFDESDQATGGSDGKNKS